ncbi:Crp/Fnr family transcriptional regulator [Taibaiella koreensis]|uniref:Crp/Fnr family transcriptional regulator n=1 Tax=Taibaiella koreensis TaxID=1268548 RepID=UPI000E5A01DD|nr:Crp/Fnr family transcriptional regulator [Taibaiella koreensis]
MKEYKASCDLERCFLCSRCLKDWLPAVAVHKKNYRIKKGQPLFTEGEAVKGIYFIYEGKAKVHKRWDDEKELIIRFAKSGDIVGHLGLGNDPYFPVSATALEPVTVCYIDMPFFQSTLAVNFNLVSDLLRFFANELQESERRMRNMVHMPVKARIAQALLQLQQQFGADEEGYIDIELSRQDLASFSGASYETLFKVINELSAQRMMKASGRRFSILNMRKMTALVAQGRDYAI